MADSITGALILVDLQRDFLPGGPLAVPRGHEVIAVVNRIMPRFDLVVATKDWHPQDHASFASQHPGAEVGDVIEVQGLSQILWPDHCIQDTPGAEFAPGLESSPIDKVIHKGIDRWVDSYSGFFDNGRRSATGLAEYLEGRSVKNVFIAGLATDYCVKFTALDAAQLGFQTRVITDACRGVELDAGDVAKAIEVMRKAGVTMTDSSALLS